MKKYMYLMIVMVFFLQMSHVPVIAEKKTVPTVDTIPTLQQAIQQEVMQWSTNFTVRYTGETATIKDKLTAIIKEAIQDPYVYANMASFTWKYDGKVNDVLIDFVIEYRISPDEEAFVKRELAKILSPMYGLSDVEKIKAAHDFIVLSSEYSNETLGSPYSIYTLLTEKKGVCQAYALTLYRMLEMLGVDVRYVPGTANNQLHAWVLVKLQQAWYHIDVTWDDPLPNRQGEVQYQYFLVSDQQMAKEHTWNTAEFPAATNASYVDFRPVFQPMLFKTTKSSVKFNEQPAIDKKESCIEERQIIQLDPIIMLFVMAEKSNQSFRQITKRTPQEKHVIRKEVSHSNLGHLLFVNLKQLLMFGYFFSLV
ncbi:transglutaminase domain-containing protein [Lysinibacillus piscis]|uniref:Transglutaminase-like domain-containing protein n=1 Tax=Lysinibacillus piscis TaxID=2518931 RepID=A0ABQ5NID9_9BACI|nr:transglutaminase domain-containing protein [Lysinibacillus sp. KH24]GLC88135.1 hypothetical protein LYSBPC_12620 [Lysinibacillus sp. KH24]